MTGLRGDYGGCLIRSRFLTLNYDMSIGSIRTCVSPVNITDVIWGYKSRPLMLITYHWGEDVTTRLIHGEHAERPMHVPRYSDMFQ